MNGQEMPIFTRTFDFLSWLLPMTNHFPRSHRHTFTRRLLDAAFDLRPPIRRMRGFDGSGAWPPPTVRYVVEFSKR